MQKYTCQNEKIAYFSRVKTMEEKEKNVMSRMTPQEKPQEPSFPTTSHPLSSQQEKVMSRMATHGSSSEDGSDDKDSSSDEETESMVAMYVRKI
jgi:hypothetical protein